MGENPQLQAEFLSPAVNAAALSNINSKGDDSLWKF